MNDARKLPPLPIAPDFEQTADNPYWLFAGANYYPSGGMGDFVGAFQSLHDAVAFLDAHYLHDGWAEVFFTEEATLTRLTQSAGTWVADGVRFKD